MMSTGFQAIICLLVLAVTYSFATETSHLDQQLWTNVASCYCMLDSAEDDADQTFEIINDVRNGYLKVSGSWPACGCSCSATTGAYRKSAGNYLLLTSESWSCAQTAGISTNEPLSDILPKSFSLESFADEPLNYTGGKGYFYLTASVPQFGTRTILTLNLIPVGMTFHCQGGLCYNLVDQEYQTHYLETPSDGIAEFDATGAQLLNKLKYKSIIVNWNRKEGRFVIEEKIKWDHSAPENQPQNWSPRC